MIELKNFTIYDDSEFEPGKCCNGGHYGFWQTYEYFPAGAEPEYYVRKYYTTHEFGICRSCGDLCQSPEDAERHEDCENRITVVEALNDLLLVIPLLDEKAQYVDGPAYSIRLGLGRE